MQPSSSTTTTTAANTSAPALPKARFNWIFTADKFSSTPSNRDGISLEEELAMRQQAAVFIYELGTNLKVYVSHSSFFLNYFHDLFRPHYCINTAVVYMHRFYMINSFQRFTRQVKTRLIYYKIFILGILESMCGFIVSCM
jgi:hypothetical protein